MNIRTNLKAGAACYTVQSGDSLSSISQQFYGNQNPSNVNKIYQSNRATIGPNPSVIYPGQNLYIPD
ncbi:MAG: LysM peptidoglycan-binding domain-containing protein [Anaerolineales bacterium]